MVGENVCDAGQVAAAAGPAFKNRARSLTGPDADATGWTLEPHVCRHCFGRLASVALVDGTRRYQCTNCGAEGSGHDPSVVCACGMGLRGSGADGLALRCQPNPEPRPDFPSLYVAAPAASGS